VTVLILPPKHLPKSVSCWLLCRRCLVAVAIRSPNKSRATQTLHHFVVRCHSRRSQPLLLLLCCERKSKTIAGRRVTENCWSQRWLRCWLFRRFARGHCIVRFFCGFCLVRRGHGTGRQRQARQCNAAHRRGIWLVGKIETKNSSTLLRRKRSSSPNARAFSVSVGAIVRSEVSKVVFLFWRARRSNAQCMTLPPVRARKPATLE